MKQLVLFFTTCIALPYFLQSTENKPHPERYCQSIEDTQKHYLTCLFAGKQTSQKYGTIIVTVEEPEEEHAISYQPGTFELFDKMNQDIDDDDSGTFDFSSINHKTFKWLQTFLDLYSEPLPERISDNPQYQYIKRNPLDDYASLVRTADFFQADQEKIGLLYALILTDNELCTKFHFNKDGVCTNKLETKNLQIGLRSIMHHRLFNKDDYNAGQASHWTYCKTTYQVIADKICQTIKKYYPKSDIRKNLYTPYKDIPQYKIAIRKNKKGKFSFSTTSRHQYNHTEILIWANGLFNLPYTEDPEFPLVKLSLLANNIFNIRLLSLTHYPFLRHLNLGDNNITTIESDAFVALPFLKVIYLNDNNIETLPPDLFRNQKKLQRLSLNSNELETIPSELFSPLENLKHLDLEKNSLKEVSSINFANCLQLHIINLINNPLSDKEKERFKEQFKDRSVSLYIR